MRVIMQNVHNDISNSYRQFVMRV